MTDSPSPWRTSLDSAVASNELSASRLALVVLLSLTLGLLLLVALFLVFRLVTDASGPASLSFESEPNFGPINGRGPRLQQYYGYYYLSRSLLGPRRLPNCLNVTTPGVLVDSAGRCQYLTTAQLNQAGLEEWLAIGATTEVFVQPNLVPPPQHTVWLGRNRYSTRGRYWLESARWEVTELPLGQTQHLDYRPRSVVTPPNVTGWYRNAQGQTYRHQASQPLAVPASWTEVWVKYE